MRRSTPRDLRQPRPTREPHRGRRRRAPPDPYGRHRRDDRSAERTTHRRNGTCREQVAVGRRVGRRMRATCTGGRRMTASLQGRRRRNHHRNRGNGQARVLGGCRTRDAGAVERADHGDRSPGRGRLHRRRRQQCDPKDGTRRPRHTRFRPVGESVSSWLGKKARGGIRRAPSPGDE
jgi:hypothetical protein